MKLYDELTRKNTSNKDSVAVDDRIRILCRQGDGFRIECRSRDRVVSLAEIIQMVRMGYAFSNISFMEPYLRS